MKLPVAPQQYDAGDQARLRGALERADDQSLKRGAAQPYLLLASPNGTVWKGVIDNSGALSWTALA